ncbi:MAG TPA: sugar phosphate isomerase/epimerase [Tepidisphaeraceae bacterium]|jgi:sugar phosphate isomerase/epimerase|nr:sugar phosphate isomerase/epimerase [Tepidisphaeraceae bacterium]
MTNHSDLRIGTIVPMDKGASYARQMLPHGFECISMTIWQQIGDLDLERIAKETLDVIGDKAVISTVGIFCNPLVKESAVRDWERVIDAAKLFNTSIVSGFAGAVPGKPVPESMAAYKKVWTDLAKRAEDNGLRIAFENCEMGGWWHDAGQWNIAHSPTGWEMMFNEVPSPAVGLQWEPCHQMVSLIDPIPQLRKLAPTGKIFHVHGKDATIAWDVVRTSGIRGGKPYVWHRTPGFGDTNWTDVISILRMNKYTGCLDIEGWHDPVYKGELETTGQVHALNYLKQCRGGAYVPNPK